MNENRAIANLLQRILDAHPPRAGSLIVTVFGDSLAGFADAVGLGSFIEILEPFGLNARQIRTAVFRLTKDDWLSCRKIGRKSYYSFTEFGRRQFERSARRIYAARPASWDGLWTLVLPAYVDGAQREELRRALSWLGFGAIANGVLAHPCADPASLADTLRELGLADQCVVLQARTDEVGSAAVLNRLTQQTWRLAEFESRYAGFITDFLPVEEALAADRRPVPADLFVLQTLMIHEYRRILLKLTDLPDELLPAAWSGRRAMELAARLYAQTRASSATFLAEALEGPAGRLRLAASATAGRFA